MGSCISSHGLAPPGITATRRQACMPETCGREAPQENERQPLQIDVQHANWKPVVNGHGKSCPRGFPVGFKKLNSWCPHGARVSDVQAARDAQQHEEPVERIPKASTDRPHVDTRSGVAVLVRRQESVAVARFRSTTTFPNFWLWLWLWLCLADHSL